MVVDVSVENGLVSWMFRTGVDEWKQRIPLSMLLPCPTISIDRTSFWRSLAITVLSPLVFAIALDWFDFTIEVTLVGSATLLLFLGYLLAPRCAGPIEWASFDTTLKEKTIYVFRDTQDDRFDTFVRALDDAILKVNQQPGSL